MPRPSQVIQNAAPSSLDGADDGEAEAATAEALLFATLPAASGGPAAALRILDESVVGRLLGQLASLGVRRAWLVTRPEWKAAVEDATVEWAADAGPDVNVLVSADVAADLVTTEQIAGQGTGPLIVAAAHVVTQGEALAGLLADPRIGSGILAGRSSPGGQSLPSILALDRRVLSAASPYHRVTRSTGCFLGVMQIDGRSRARLSGISRELAELVARVPSPESGPAPPVAADAATSLLLVGLVRSGVDVYAGDVRGFVYGTPLSAADASATAQDLSANDEEEARLEAAVKVNDSFFTTLLVSPYSKHLARFAARRGWSPNAVTWLSFGIGLLAAASFALGSRAGLIAGAVLLQASFTVDCVDGQLARYVRSFSSLGAWLDSVFDRTKEYLVYAGLAIGSTRGFGEDVWTLAAAALALQTVRHLLDTSYEASQRIDVASVPALPLERPDDSPLASALPFPGRASEAVKAGRRRSNWKLWAHRILRLPIGERFALISLTAALATPRVTFIALLAWGGVAAVYAVAGRLLAAFPESARVVRALVK